MAQAGRPATGTVHANRRRRRAALSLRHSRHAPTVCQRTVAMAGYRTGPCPPPVREIRAGLCLAAKGTTVTMLTPSTLFGGLCLPGCVHWQAAGNIFLLAAEAVAAEENAALHAGVAFAARHLPASAVFLVGAAPSAMAHFQGFSPGQAQKVNPETCTPSAP